MQIAKRWSIYTKEKMNNVNRNYAVYELTDSTKCFVS